MTRLALRGEVRRLHGHGVAGRPDRPWPEGPLLGQERAQAQRAQAQRGALQEGPAAQETGRAEVTHGIRPRHQSTNINSLAMRSTCASCSQGVSRGVGGPAKSRAASQVEARVRAELADLGRPEVLVAVQAARGGRRRNRSCRRPRPRSGRRRARPSRCGPSADFRTPWRLETIQQRMPSPAATSWIAVDRIATVAFLGAVQRRIAACWRSLPACPPWAVSWTQPRSGSGHCGPPPQADPLKWGSGWKPVTRPVPASTAP